MRLAKTVRADVVGSLLRPPELLEAREHEHRVVAELAEKVWR